MQIAKKLVMSLGLTSFKDINHRNFNQVKELLDTHIDNYFTMAVNDIDNALKNLYNSSYETEISLQQLSATFRRADLIELLNKQV